jgi:hypothetical protein
MKTLEKFIDFMSKLLFGKKSVMPWVLLLSITTMSAQPRAQYGRVYGQRDTQRYAFVSAGLDIRNAAVGSKPTNNKSELDYTLKLGARDNHFEAAVFYESFPRIEFQAYGVNFNGVAEIFKNTDLAVGIELGNIVRYKKESHFMGGLNGEVRYDLGGVLIGLQLNVRLRTDNWYKGGPTPIVPSVGINVIKKIR